MTIDTAFFLGFVCGAGVVTAFAGLVIVIGAVGVSP